MKSNDNIPEDELILAELIAAASERGLKGCKGSEFVDNRCVPLSFSEIQDGRYNLESCCAIGAWKLSGAFKGRTPDGLITGNDCSKGYGCPTNTSKVFVRNWNIGAAFNLAMDPDA